MVLLINHNLHLTIDARTLKMAFPSFQISKVSGGACPQTPLESRDRRNLDSNSHLLFQTRPPTSKHFETPVQAYTPFGFRYSFAGGFTNDHEGTGMEINNSRYDSQFHEHTCVSFVCVSKRRQSRELEMFLFCLWNEFIVSIMRLSVFYFSAYKTELELKLIWFYQLS